MKKFVNNLELFKSELLDHLKSGRGLWDFNRRDSINVNVSTIKLWLKNHPEAFEPYYKLVKCGNKRRASNTVICENCLSAIFWFDVKDVEKVKQDNSLEYFDILQTMWLDQNNRKDVCPFCLYDPFIKNKKSKFINAKRETVLERTII